MIGIPGGVAPEFIRQVGKVNVRKTPVTDFMDTLS